MAWVNPITWATGTALSAANLNTIRDALKAIGDPWTSYTPTLIASTTNPTLGAGSITGSYIKAGNLVMFRFTIVFGAGMTPGSGVYAVSLPTSVDAAMLTHHPIGNAVLFDTSVPSVLQRSLTLSATGGDKLNIRDDAGTRLEHNVPVTWASGDRFMGSGFYESA